ncbi:1-deoxy-D-xylulose-5-phosphate reductoisomerase [Candidatus Bipolaricaulota bacterium]|nr:1-deoxy-D-xylulose-5-phosphate reductoisomerase [Candidatus Bipolaricaulota bacterium]
MDREGTRLAVLGSTGSIGTQTLDVVLRLRDAGYDIEVVALAAGRNSKRLLEQITVFRPRVVSVADEQTADLIRSTVTACEVVFGEGGLRKIVERDDIDMVLNALVGAIGLLPTLQALRSGHRVALANKESLVIGGDWVRAELGSETDRLLPVDSEHNAVWQCMRAGTADEVRRIVLTASGGSLRDTPLEELVGVTPERALAHPNWDMGRRITMDSATMVNKGFEVVEAHHLFNLPYDRIDVLLHPSSTIHAMVEYVDGSWIAEMASADMRLPIQYALTHPHRVDSGLSRLSMENLDKLRLQPVDEARYPAYALVLRAAKLGGTALAAVNAADEVLVQQFLARVIGFPDISRGLEFVVEKWLCLPREQKFPPITTCVAPLIEVDQWARSLILDWTASQADA